jgi:putative PEP-CTERM system histidine kinase
VRGEEDDMPKGWAGWHAKPELVSVPDEIELSMGDPGLISHSAGAVMFLVLAALLAAGWEGRAERSRPVALVVAVLVGVAWAGLLAAESAMGSPAGQSTAGFLLEMARNASWLFFMTTLLYQDDSGRPARRPALLLGGALVVFTVLGLWTAPFGFSRDSGDLLVSPREAGLLITALLGLVVVEQFFRNTRPERRWAVKYLCVGLVGIFCYDLYLYAEALATGAINRDLWNARGIVNALAAPLIAISASRNPDWSTRIFVSRHVVFYTASLLSVGAFLLVAGLGGVYIKSLGGDWGSFAQIVFLFGSAVLLLAIVLSASFRARIRVFLAKHFYSNKYDYREEWLGFIARLSDAQDRVSPQERVVRAIGDLVDSTGGLLWLADGQGNLTCVAGLEMLCPDEDTLQNDRLERFWADRDWVIDLAEYRDQPDAYESLELPSWLGGFSNAWLLVPLREARGLLGFVLLAQSRAPRRLNWEDWDLLKTAAREAANYLALGLASDKLAQAQQFEAFNRLSAYVVHDLKNLIAQLDLVVANAGRHQGNPEFMADAIQTVGNSVSKMKHLLAQLRKGRFELSRAKRTDLADVLAEVVAARAVELPCPMLEHEARIEACVNADPDQLAAILGHLVQNGQEAAGPNGEVSIRLLREPRQAVIEIEDTGPGMHRDFIRERLFAPFDTTKGNAGMGIGAYEAREFVRALGGSLSVVSEVGRGTVFTVNLPLAEAESQVASV